MRTCRDCGRALPTTAFYRDRKRRDGLHTYCIACCKSRAKKNYRGAAYSREQARLWRAKNPRANKSLKLKHAFGITIEDYEAMLALQGGRCAICGATPDLGVCLCVDHDHESTHVRGLLCNACNKAIGFMRDDPARLLKAAEYLKPDIFEATYEKVDE